MKLLEVATLDELGPQHVTQLARLQPVARPVADAAELAASRLPVQL
jgi:L-lactate dehydrogenase (cytochrome)